jgi:hypothetical protein
MEYRPSSVSKEALLTSESIALLEQHYSFEVYVGYHGDGLPDAPRNIADFLATPTDLEYKVAEELIGGMEDSDVLFVEGPGLGRERPSALPHDLPLTSWCSIRDSFQQYRAESTIDAWGHATMRAVLQGIPVIYADCSKADLKNMGREEFQDVSLMRQADESLRQKINRIREIRACEILVTWALENLPMEAPAEEAKKRRLVLLFGERHTGGLEERFEAMGLSPTITQLPRNDLETRFAERLSQITQWRYQTAKRILPTASTLH